MKQYTDLVNHILENGTKKEDRTGTGTISVFGYQTRFDLSEGFPLVTTKHMATNAMVSELLWFLEGSTDERRLAEITFSKNRKDIIGKKTIWTANADNQGVAKGYINNDTIKQLGPVYGSQWRSWGQRGHDQIQTVVNDIKKNPDSRRLIVSAWNVEDINKMTLPPCHVLFQFYVLNGKLSCQLYQRSCDVGLGAPFNIASYALLTHLVAEVCSLEVGEFIYTLGDAHIYLNHVEQLTEQASRIPLPLPTLKILNKRDRLDAFVKEDLVFENYRSYPSIKMEMSV